MSTKVAENKTIYEAYTKLRGCLYEKNHPDFSPANRGPRFTGISSETQISPNIKLLIKKAG